MSEWREIAESESLALLRRAVAPRVLEIERSVLRERLTEVELARLQGEYAAYDTMLNLPRLKAEQEELLREQRRKADLTEVRPYRREVR